MHSIAISPCPNDVFLFANSLHSKSDAIQVAAFPLQELHKLAAARSFSFIKTSFAQWLELKAGYDLMPVGHAFGRGFGPLLIGSERVVFESSSQHCRQKILVPGLSSTSAALIRCLFPKAIISEAPFSEIPYLVLKENCLGVVVHEARFHLDSRLQVLLDLGSEYERRFNRNVPLGVFLVQKGIAKSYIDAVTQILLESYSFAKKNPDIVESLFAKHSQSNSLVDCWQHVELYCPFENLELSAKDRDDMKFFTQNFARN